MKVACHTFGCKLNRFETQVLAEDLRRAGHQIVSWREGADLYVVNTCTVTGKSEAECRKFIRRISRENPGAEIIAAGCYADRDPEGLASLPGVRLVVGNRAKAALAELIPAPGVGQALLVLDHPSGLPPSPFPLLDGFGERTRAFVKIQDGCDRRCSYCIVCLVRGPNRSELEENVLAQVERLARAGYREVVLSGVHLGSWGSDQKPKRTLAELLEKLAAIPSGPRIRLSSIEPQEFDDRLLEAVAQNPRICRHFHVPLQSGSDRILSRMNRDYRAEDYRRLIRRLDRIMPGAGIGTDVIVGFPGESDEEFRATLDLVAELPFTYLHVFSFSRRPGTPAASLPAQVSAETKEERSRLLRSLGTDKALAYRRKFIGRKMDVLVESKRDARTGLLKGISDTYLRVLFDGPDRLANTCTAIVIDKAEGKDIYGRLPD